MSPADWEELLDLYVTHAGDDMDADGQLAFLAVLSHQAPRSKRATNLLWLIADR
jgi:hypothetical protein